jgi:hypothetical protein
MRRIAEDLRRGHNLDTYVIALAGMAFAVVSLFGDIVPESLQWAVCSGGIGLLVYHLTIPDRQQGPEVLGDRDDLMRSAFHERLSRSTEVWLFAPSAKNFLNTINSSVIRRQVLARSDGRIRAVILDPADPDVVEAVGRQLTGEYAAQPFGDSLNAAFSTLSNMALWPMAGRLAFRLLDLNPGFSIVALDPHGRDGLVIVEFHGFHNESSAHRMHLRIRRADDPRWFEYWIEQFERIWQAARVPGP